LGDSVNPGFHGTNSPDEKLMQGLEHFQLKC
jgi:hypothetical protein